LLPKTPQTPPVGSDYFCRAEFQSQDRPRHHPAVATKLWHRPPGWQWKIQSAIPRPGNPRDWIKQDLPTQISTIQEPTQKASDRLTAASDGTFPDVARILFLGDSITYSGHYVTLLETAIRLQYPSRNVELLNLGLPSETVAGLSEPGHAGGQFPRPDLHERLTRVLDQVQPELVVACYGMNDGIYHPLSDERFAAYRDGIERLRAAVLERNAQLLLLTPPMFDARPIADRLLPAGQAAYPQPYVEYDSVLQHYAAWLLSKRTDHWQVLDVHGAMSRAVADRRGSDPDFTFAADGVHPNEAGQAVIAGVLAQHWGLQLGDRETEPGSAERSQLRNDVSHVVAKRQELLKHAWLTRTRHMRPGIPAGRDWEEALKAAAELGQQISARIGRE
jgi:lysophospholipase L1-like esterase